MDDVVTSCDCAPSPTGPPAWWSPCCSGQRPAAYTRRGWAGRAAAARRLVEEGPGSTGQGGG